MEMMLSRRKWLPCIILIDFLSIWSLLFTNFFAIVSSTDAITSSHITSDFVNDPSATSAPRNSLLESIWNSFKQTIENTANSLASSSTATQSSAAGDEQSAFRAERQREEMANRRTLLFQRSLSEHYLQQFVQSTPSQWNDYHSPKKQQYSKQGSELLERESEGSWSHDKQRKRPHPDSIRWEQTDPFSEGGTICYCYSESSESYWSFQWCPFRKIYQGRRDTTTGKLQPKHSLGRFTVKTVDNGYKPNRLVANALAEASKARYPKAVAVDLYLDGDLCDAQSDVGRVSVVVTHDETSDHCHVPTATSGEERHHAKWSISSVDEIRTCQYVLHVCKLSTAEERPTVDSILKSSDDITYSNWNFSNMSEQDAADLNQTIFRIQHLTDSYRRKTTVNVHSTSSPDVLTSLHSGLPPIPPSRIQANLKLIKEMFIHAYDSYMYHGYPAPEVKPLTCRPATFDLVKIPGLTLIDCLDTLITMGNYTEFARAVERLRSLNDHTAEEAGLFTGGGLFAINQNVSVFETNIRVLGGLLSAHQLAEAFVHDTVLYRDVHANDGTILVGETRNIGDCGMQDAGRTDRSNALANDCDGTSVLDCKQEQSPQAVCHNQTSKFWVYDGFLLELARDIGNRLLPAFNTRTGIPYGTVNLLSGIPKGETPIASLAGGGTLSLEMELLGRLTGDESFGRAAKLASRALWMRRSHHDLLGKHMCTRRGEWTESLSGIGSNSDSFYEYLIKHHILFPEDTDFWLQLVAAYGGIYKESRMGEWYGDVDMSRGISTGGASRRVFEALMAFYPGLQVLLGEITPAARTLNSFFLVREYLGFLPERFNFGMWKVDSNGGKHLLRPELLESAYFLHRSSKGIQQQFRPGLNISSEDSSSWQWAGDFALHTIEKLTRSQCGYASIRDVSTSTTGALNAEKRSTRLSNEMPSYFLSETLKYLYLLFDDSNLLHTDDDHDWIFTTEAHPFHYEEKFNSKSRLPKLEEDRKSLKERLRRRIANGKKREAALWEGLEDEKWTGASESETFLQQLEPLASDARGIYEAKKIVDMKIGYSSHLTEPFLPHKISSDGVDTFDERLKKTNPAYLSVRSLGNGLDISMSCPNVYKTDFLWIRALNGGIVDYTDIYMSRVHDEVSVSESRKAVLGSFDAIGLYGAGVHIDSLYDGSSLCPVRVANERSDSYLSNSDANQSKSHEDTKSGLTRFDMGALGSFEVSAFPEGSGFFIQHVETGETIVTTLIDGEADPVNGQQSFVLVYNSAGEEPSAQRSVVVADLHGNSYSCVVQIVESLLDSEEGPFCMLHDVGEEVELEVPTRSNSKGVKVAEFPCAPALFGPTHISNLKDVGAITVEAAIQPPIFDQEYGCGGPFADSEASGTSFSLNRQPDDDAAGKDANSFVCENKVISLVHRGICTFQEKSMNQKNSFNAKGVIVINTSNDELFVMSGGGLHENPEKNGDSSFPVTVLVTGSDGQAILDIAESFQKNHHSQLQAKISLVRVESDTTQSESESKTAGTNFWPRVRASPEALQIFSRSGWGVHAVQRSTNKRSGEMEWQLLLMSHDAIED